MVFRCEDFTEYLRTHELMFFCEQVGLFFVIIQRLGFLVVIQLESSPFFSPTGLA
jgi:hypothetical protein